MNFDAVAGEYEKGRPSYPPAVYDALEPLSGALVLEGGAGTGIATSELLQRGARVVTFDVSMRMTSQATQRIPGLLAVIADGARLPFRQQSADLLCFAQACHWLEENRRWPEAARVLRPGGRWAGWWSHARADGEAWFDTYWDAVEAACPGVSRIQRDRDWGEDISRSGFFSSSARLTIPWVRRVRVETWVIEERSRLYVAALPRAGREEFLHHIRRLVLERFPTGDMAVPYETWLWVAKKQSS